MNFNRWIDIYKRQPLPAERADRFDEAAFLHEVQLDDDEMEQGWEKQDRARIRSFCVFILLSLQHWGQREIWLILAADVFLAAAVFASWWQRRLRRKVDREYQDSLLARIARAEKLIQMRQSYLRIEPAFSAPGGLLAAGLVGRLLRDHGCSSPTIIGAAVGVGLLFTGLTWWLILADCRKQRAVFSQRLDHLRRVRARLLNSENESPSSPLSP